MSPPPPTCAVAVLGVGNPLFGDDGAGIELLSRLASTALPAGVELLDGGTDGLFLLPFLEDAERLLVLDAADLGASPGTVAELDGAALPTVLRGSLSAHQLGLLDVLGAARLRGREPGEIRIVAIQPATLSFGWGLSPAVESALPAALELALTVIARWTRTPGAAAEEPRHAAAAL